MEESFDQFGFDLIFVHHFLECVQDRVHADPVLDGFPGVFAESIEQFLFWEIMKSVDDLIGKAHKSIDAIDRVVHLFIQSIDAQGKRSAVGPGDHSGRAEGNFMVEIHHIIGG